MRKILTLLTAFFLLFNTHKAAAQTFSVQHDTVYYNYPSGLQTIMDGVDNLSTVTTDSLTLKWSVIATNFPADWVAVSGVCDNKTCYAMNLLWPSGTVKLSNKYPDGLGGFDMQTNLSSATSTGCYYVTVKMFNNAVPTDSATETYIICNSPTAVPNVNKTTEVALYPNPSTSELNVVYDPANDVKNISVYNIIGKVMAVYKASDVNGANLDISNLPSGIYFLRLFNSEGGLVATKKFTKQ